MWERAWVSVWYGLIALLVGYELWSLLDRREATPPLTQVLVREVPWWVTLPFLVWLLAHFVVAYGRQYWWR